MTRSRAASIVSASEINQSKSPKKEKKDKKDKKSKKIKKDKKEKKDKKDKKKKPVDSDFSEDEQPMVKALATIFKEEKIPRKKSQNEPEEEVVATKKDFMTEMKFEDLSIHEDTKRAISQVFKYDLLTQVQE